MDEKKNNILEDLSFEPIPHMMETLRAQGCISHDELIERLVKPLL